MKIYIAFILIVLCLSKVSAQNSTDLETSSYEFIAELDAKNSFNSKYEFCQEFSNLDSNSNFKVEYYDPYLSDQSKINSGNSGKDSFEDIAKIKGVDVVYISKSMLGMMSNMNMPGINVGNAAGKLESLQVFSAEQKNSINSLKTALDKILKEGKYETLMQTKDDDSNTSFYSKQLEKGNSEMLIVTEEPSEFNIVRFIGKLSLTYLQNITK